MKLQDINPQDVHDALDARLAAIEGEAGTLGDTREKLEADIRKCITCTGRTLMYPDSANHTVEFLSTTVDSVIGWLDRQAAITERECIDRWDAKATLQIAYLKAKVDELTEVRDELFEQVATLEGQCEACGLWPDGKDFEQTHMRLPVDADGVPIRPGDTIIYREIITPYDCDTLVLYEDGEWRVHTTDSGLLNPRECRHSQPDTVESLLHEFLRRWSMGCARIRTRPRRGAAVLIPHGFAARAGLSVRLDLDRHSDSPVRFRLFRSHSTHPLSIAEDALYMSSMRTHVCVE